MNVRFVVFEIGDFIDSVGKFGQIGSVALIIEVLLQSDVGVEIFHQRVESRFFFCGQFFVEFEGFCANDPVADQSHHRNGESDCRSGEARCKARCHGKQHCACGQKAFCFYGFFGFDRFDAFSFVEAFAWIAETGFNKSGPAFFVSGRSFFSEASVGEWSEIAFVHFAVILQIFADGRGIFCVAFFFADAFADNVQNKQNDNQSQCAEADKLGYVIGEREFLKCRDAELFAQPRDQIN